MKALKGKPCAKSLVPQRLWDLNQLRAANRNVICEEKLVGPVQGLTAIKHERRFWPLRRSAIGEKHIGSGSVRETSPDPKPWLDRHSALCTKKSDWQKKADDDSATNPAGETTPSDCALLPGIVSKVAISKEKVEVQRHRKVAPSRTPSGQ